jgi:uncharacterized protein
MRVLFFLLFLALIVLGHWFIRTRLVDDLGLVGRARTMLTAIVVALFTSMIVMAIMQRRLRLPVVAWLSYGWMGWASYLFLGLLFGSVMLGIRRLVTGNRKQTNAPDAQLAPSLASDDVPQDPVRRDGLARLLTLGAAAISAVATGAGVRSVLIGPSVSRIRIRLGERNSPSATESQVRIVQITDLHVGPTIGVGYVENVVALCNALNPDLVVITGDLVDGSVNILREHVAPLANLKARLGVYFVTGNHEYYSGADEWITHVRSLGMRVLRNERVDLGVFELAGCDDITSHRYEGHGEDLAKACGSRTSHKPLVLLAHQPLTVLEACRHGVDLQISGHTHGGQFVPWNYAVKLQQPYVAGLHQHQGTLIYVSRGTGYWGPPMRLGSPSEIACLDVTIHSV